MIGVFLAALIVRVVFTVQVGSSPFFQHPLVDGSGNDRSALALLTGKWPSKDVFFQPPLFVYFLALVYKIFGHGYFAIRFLHNILGAFTCLFSYLAAKEVFGRRAAIITAVILTLYGPLIFEEYELLPTTLFIFFNSVLTYGLIHRRAFRSLLKTFLLGLIMGLSCITRSEFLIFLPFALFFIWFDARNVNLNRSKPLLCAAVFFLGVALVVSVVTVRNYIADKKIILISANAGDNFFIGNNIESEKVASSWRGGNFFTEPLSGSVEKVINTGSRLGTYERNQFYFTKFLEFVRNDPFRFSFGIFKKLCYFWNGLEIWRFTDFYFMGRYSSVLRYLLWNKGFIYFPFGIVAPLALLGMALSLKYWRRAILFYMLTLSLMFVPVLFIVISRYRLPVIPVLAIFAGYGSLAVYNYISCKNFKGFLMAFFAIMILLVAVNRPCFDLNQNIPSPSLMYGELGRIMIAEKKAGEAMEAYLEARKRWPGHPVPWVSLGRLCRAAGRFDEAARAFEEYIKENPNSRDRNDIERELEDLKLKETVKNDLIKGETENGK